MTNWRTLLVAALTLLWVVGLAGAQSNDGVPQIGDFGYKHDEYHEAYQKVFGAHCGCGDGECRVSKYRPTQLGSPNHYDVWVAGDWRPLPAEIFMPDPKIVPPVLWQEEAHVCAYGDAYARGKVPVTIKCVLLNLRGA